MSSEGKCTPLPVITLRRQWRGPEHGEQALNVSALFLARYVSRCISSGRRLPVGKYFCEFLGVPPPPTGKDLCLLRQQQSCTQPYWGNGGTIWCLSMWKVIRVLCPKDKPACAGSTVPEKASGCSEDKAQFYSSITSARGRGDGVSVTYSVKSSVPRPEGSSWQCREPRKPSCSCPQAAELRSWERAGWLTSDPSGAEQPPVSAGSASALRSHVAVRGWSRSRAPLREP